MAIGAFNVLSRVGLRVPDDVIDLLKVVATEPEVERLIIAAERQARSGESTCHRVDRRTYTVCLYDLVQ